MAVFNPKTDQIKDEKYQKMLDRISCNETVYFTANQFYTFYLGLGPSLTKRIFAWGLSILSLIVLLYPFPQATTESYVWRIIFFAGAVTYANTLPRSAKVSKEKFDELLKRWKKVNPIPTLVTDLNLKQPPPAFGEQDLYEYGVEGIIIVDQDIYVDLIVLNNYQSDWKSVVMSQNGYPNYLQNKVQKLIKEDPTIKIYYLHDATTTVEDMKKQVRNILDLPNTVDESDLGLTKADVDRLKVFNNRKEEAGGVKLDFIPPSNLAQTMGIALMGGLLLVEALEANQNQSNFVSDFG
ncbi:MAG: hypothetical protein MK212_15290 [Saprospiraceae bacterium]|nr:hypothetical protein [Saprospiraceae bacterium]